MTEQPGQDAPIAQDAHTTGAQDAPQTAVKTTPEQVSDLPEWAQRLIRDTRQEAKAHREAREQLEQAQRAADAKKLQERGEWQKLAEQLKGENEALLAMKEKADAADAVLQKVLDAQLAQLPNDAQEMVTSMPGDVQAKLNWLSVNQARLMRPAAPNLDAGARGDAQAAPIKLTNAQRAVARSARMTDEQYIAALKKMQQAAPQE